MKLIGPSDSDILDYYIDILQALNMPEQTVWNEFRSFGHFNLHCLFWDGSQEGLIE